MYYDSVAKISFFYLFLSLLLPTVDTSDRQVMAKLYHDLTKEEVQILRNLYKQEKLGKPSKPNRTKEPALKVKRGILFIHSFLINTLTDAKKKIEEKSINKRQQRKKKIRDELKRQLGKVMILSPLYCCSYS